MVERSLEDPTHVFLGEMVRAEPFGGDSFGERRAKEYTVLYPQCVLRELGQLFAEYNEAFAPLVECNCEWESDYAQCIPKGSHEFINFVVQVDMVGLPDAYLASAAAGERSGQDVREDLRRAVFEIDNSTAGYRFYPFLRGVWGGLRAQLGKPIALLATTQGKYEEMLEFEFGGDASDKTVRKISGFDRFFNPEQFVRHITTPGGGEYKCDFALYVRSSYPLEKQRDPRVHVEEPLLGDAAIRQVIKANTLTLNIDAPEMEYERRINDTKEYMSSMRMAAIVTDADALKCQNGSIFPPTFEQHLAKRGADRMAQHMSRDQLRIRAKPLKGSYGCYGHVWGAWDSRVNNKIAKMMSRYGACVLQPELSTPLLMSELGERYTFMDRLFFARTGEDQPYFVGGQRIMLPVDSPEAIKGRLHLNHDAVVVDIIPDKAAAEGAVRTPSSSCSSSSCSSSSSSSSSIS